MPQLNDGGSAVAIVDQETILPGTGPGLQEVPFEGTSRYPVTDAFPMPGRIRNILGSVGVVRRPGHPEMPAPEDDGMEKVMRYLRDHFREDVPMKVLADLVRLSLRQFHRNFKKRFGLPPNQYLIRMRVMAARDLLLKENRPVAEIAYTLGFADDTLFIRQFKSRMGMTPLQYRKTRR